MYLFLTFLTANSLPAWKTTNTMAFPPYPILLATAFLLGNGYWMLPEKQSRFDCLKHIHNKILYDNIMYNL